MFVNLNHWTLHPPLSSSFVRTDHSNLLLLKWTHIKILRRMIYQACSKYAMNVFWKQMRWRHGIHLQFISQLENSEVYCAWSFNHKQTNMENKIFIYPCFWHLGCSEFYIFLVCKRFLKVWYLESTNQIF